MIQLKTFMELINYRITEGDKFQWNCYGENAYNLTSWNGLHSKDGWSANIVFDTNTQIVYEVDVCDYTHDRSYRLINPEYVDAYAHERDTEGLDDTAWDEVKYIDLTVEHDWLEKAQAIISNEKYDTRIQMEVEFSDDDLFEYMKLAHKLDITFNQLIEKALREVINNKNNV